MSVSNNVNAKRRLTYSSSKAKAEHIKKQQQERERQQRIREREELARNLQTLTDKRFPSRHTMSLAQRIDRLEVCEAQSLAMLDRFMEFIAEKKCPFTMSTADLDDADKPDDSNNAGHNSNTSSNHPYL